MNWLKIKDTRGRESRTLLFVTIAIVLLYLKFIVAGITLGGVSFPAMTAAEFGTSFAAIMLVWLGREWTEKVARKAVPNEV